MKFGIRWNMRGLEPIEETSQISDGATPSQQKTLMGSSHKVRTGTISQNWGMKDLRSLSGLPRMDPGSSEKLSPTGEE